ncbi:hypothetical protein PLICRDRAFT_42081 [Plicaturopsis crispa FD-325 SS-3]|nr:hypothetical protein PLICRDRAFT_42081 [Plicaturopsis crispa FD-325 SS-3]
MQPPTDENAPSASERSLSVPAGDRHPKKSRNEDNEGDSGTTSQHTTKRSLSPSPENSSKKSRTGDIEEAVATTPPPTDSPQHDQDPQSSIDKPLSDDDARPPLKRVRTAGGVVYHVGYPRPCHLKRMPFELLAEILGHTTSTKDALSLARTSKYFCVTLTSPTAVYIWRRLRKQSVPLPIPDPLPNFTESSYAAFLFDGGLCSVCKKHTNALYASFALRIRICARPECRSRMDRDLLLKPTHLHFPRTVTPQTTMLLKWFLRVESERCLNPISTSTIIRNWPDMEPAVLRSDWEMALQEIEALKSEAEILAYQEKCQKKTDRLSMYMTAAVKMSEWAAARQLKFRTIKDSNETVARALATSEGWDYWELMNAESYSDLHRRRTRTLEEVTANDVAPIRAQIEVDMVKNAERRLRRKAEAAYRQGREEVKAYYEVLRSSGQYKVLPTLEVFRQIPVIKILQNRPNESTGAAGTGTGTGTGTGVVTSGAGTSVAAELKESAIVKDLIKDHLGTWVAQMREAFADMLGMPKWKSPSTKKLHPVDRLTARFRCKRCHSVARRYKEEECLDFAGVCAHECPPTDKRKAKLAWTIDQFEPDEKAIAVINDLLRLCNANPEDVQSHVAFADIPPRIRCRSCSGNILMGPRHVIGHCQRHEKMDVLLLSPEDVKGVPPVEPGLCAKIMMGYTARAKKMQNYVVFACRHCGNLPVPRAAVGGNNAQGNPSTAESKAIAAPDADMNGDAGNATAVSLSQPRSTKYFSFNGLRSHMKTLHSIEVIRDEDFFYDRDEAKRQEKKISVDKL